MKPALLVLCVVALLQACSNGDRAASSGVDPAVKESASANATTPDYTAARTTNPTLYDILPDKAITFSLPLILRGDQTVVVPNGKTRRGLSLEYQGLDAHQLWESLDTSFDNAGYTPGTRDTDASGKGSLKFSKDGASALTVSVVPDAEKGDAGVIWIGWNVAPSPSVAK